MPFGVRETGAATPGPARVDFDMLWKLAIAPALDQLGYRAVRADQDLGPLIIKEMLERLYYSDLVVADVSIANANAYYEVGIRHAARSTGCVLIAADWARPVFDLAQMRHVSYPNPNAILDQARAQAIIDLLIKAIPERAVSNTPMLETIAGYPNAQPDGVRARELAGELEAFEDLRARMATINSMPKADRAALAQPIFQQHPAATTIRASVAVEMVKFIRDVVDDWQAARTYIETLPKIMRDQSFMQEQLALAQSKQGNHISAITALNKLISLAGDTSERQGLVGGRYKKLYNESVKAAKADALGTSKPNAAFLEQAIKHYELGMRLDLNDYFPSCNLPGLYRERGGLGDEDRAVAAAAVARFACERSLKRNPDDVWGKPTFLGLAFAERNVTAAEEIAQWVERDTGAGWMLDTTLDDLRRYVAQTSDAATRDRMQAIVDRLVALL
jgi:tetratricopeptide (TPR) repeat protein